LLSLQTHSWHQVTGVETASHSSTGLLCAPPNQVAGHCAEGGNLGPLVDKAGRFYKPLQDNQRGQNEVEFYEKFW
ncbi:hypothetical protein KI387_019508, partial [Taxus chinensis]